MNGYSYLTLEQRREIERMYAEGERVVDIAARLKRSVAAIYEELKRGYTGEFPSPQRRIYKYHISPHNIRKGGSWTLPYCFYIILSPKAFAQHPVQQEENHISQKQHDRRHDGSRLGKFLRQCFHSHQVNEQPVQNQNHGIKQHSLP